MPEFALGLASSRDIWAAVACREAIQLCPADSPQTEPGLAVVLASKGTSKQILATEGAGREGTQAKGQKLPPFLEGSQASCWGVPGMFLPGCPLWAWCFAAIAHLTLVEPIAGGIGTSFLQLTKLRYTVFCCV